MPIFSEHALGLFNQGYKTIPLVQGQKFPAIKGWTSTNPTDELLNEWCSMYPMNNIGLLCGQVSGVVCIDVDVDDESIVERLEKYLPDTPLVKQGLKGYTAIYKYNGEKAEKLKLPGESKPFVEILSDGNQTVLPPSIHPETGEPYEWVGDLLPQEVQVEDLPTLPVDFVKNIKKEFGLTTQNPSSQKTIAPISTRVELSKATLYFLTHGESIKGKTWHDALVEAAFDFKQSGYLLEEAIERLHDAARPHEGELNQSDIYQITDVYENRELQSYSKQESKSKSQLEQVVDMVSEYEIFQSNANEYFIRINENGFTKDIQIASAHFRRWIRIESKERFGFLLKDNSVREVCEYAKAMADVQGIKYPVHLRVAHQDGKIYVDLGNDDWDMIEINKSEWLKKKIEGVSFKRPDALSPQVVPSPTSDIELLKKYLNFESENDYLLIKAFLLGTFNPHGGLPILILSGEQGSAKSTTSKVLKELIDPSKIPLRVCPKNSEDIVIAANGTFLLVFDNLSGVQNKLSDTFCNLSTGGAMTTRELFTNKNEVVFNFKRPVILNGIDDVSSRGDLLSRSILLTLPPIIDNNRKLERQFWKEFEQDKPKILSALYGAVSKSLRDLENVKLIHSPRMADFAQWVSAGCEPIGFTQKEFENAYTENQNFASKDSLHSAILYKPLLKLLETNPTWSGTPTELLEALTDEAGDLAIQKRFPNAPNRMTSILARMSPALRKDGITIESARTGKGRKITITSKLSKKGPTQSTPKVSDGGDAQNPSRKVRKFNKPNRFSKVAKKDN